MLLTQKGLRRTHWRWKGYPYQNNCSLTDCVQDFSLVRLARTGPLLTFSPLCDDWGDFYPWQLCLQKWPCRILKWCLCASPVVYIRVISFSSRWLIHCWLYLVMLDVVLCCLAWQFQPLVSHTHYPWRALRLWCIINIVTHVHSLIITFVQLFGTLIMCNYHHGFVSQLEFVWLCGKQHA